MVFFISSVKVVVNGKAEANLLHSEPVKFSTIFTNSI